MTGPTAKARTSIIVYGPQGSGKTRNAEAMMRLFDLPNLVDEYDAERSSIPDRGTLALFTGTEDEIRLPKGSPVLTVSIGTVRSLLAARASAGAGEAEAPVDWAEALRQWAEGRQWIDDGGYSSAQVLTEALHIAVGEQTATIKARLARCAGQLGWTSVERGFLRKEVYWYPPPGLAPGWEFVKAPQPPEAAATILRNAAQAIDNRAALRDCPQGERSMARCVAAFNAITGHELTEVQGWHFMELLKLARATAGGHHLDDHTDRAAYAALAGEAAERQA